MDHDSLASSGDPRPVEDEIFADALALPEPERTDFVARACGDDAALRAAVLSLLAAHPAAQRYFEGAPHLSDSRFAPATARAPGDVIGAYRIVSLVAEGGMGAVYRATRIDDFEKQVAIKCIRAVHGGGDFVERFRQERQVLARLEHAGIARLLDGGTDASGQPYLVMEFVDGVSLLAYADAHRLDTRSRLELFLSVCEAVQYAHRHLVIHRDLKPGNILVDVEGRVKLLDFGIAKVLTDAAGQVGDALPTVVPALTPAYASPEQLRGEAVSTATDVYSLGVVLYELTVGARPYEVSATLDAQTVRAICETEPTRPSRAARHASDESASRRASTPARLSRLLTGDLDTIVLCALRKDPERRYASVAELADDLLRFLDNRPVRARPESLSYLLTKFVQRHRWAVAMATALLVVVAGAWFLTLHTNRRLDEEAQRARRLAYVSSLAAAESAIRDNRVEEARARLEAAPAELRGWEWNHLHGRTDRSLGTARAHEKGITSVAFSTGDSSVFTASLDGRVREWSVPGAAMLGEWGPFGAGVESIALLSEAFALGLEDGRVLVVSRADDSFVTLHTGHGWVSVAADEQRGRLATGHRDGSVRVFDLTSHAPIAQWQAHDAFAVPAWTADGRGIVTGGGDGAVRIWDPSTFVLLRELPSHERRVYALAVSDEGRHVASASMDRSVHVVDLSSGALMTSFHGHRATVSSVCFLRDGERVASCGPDGRLVTWNRVDGTVRSELRGHPADVSAVAASFDGRMLATGDWSGTLKTWRATTDDVRTLAPPSIRTMIPQVFQAATDSAARWLTCAFNQGMLAVWRLDDPADSPRVIDEVDESTHVVFAPDGRHVIGANPYGRLVVFDLAVGAPTDSLQAHDGPIRDFAASPDGAYWATCADDSLVRIWNVTTRTLQRELRPHDGPVLGIAFGTESQLASCGADSTVRILEVSDGRTRIVGRHDAPVIDVAVSRRSERLVSLSREGTLRVWDLQAGTLVAEARSARSRPVAVAWSEDAHRLAVGGSDGVVRLHDASTLEEVVALHGHVARIHSVTFTPRDRYLVTTSRDGTVRLWDHGVTGLD
jgi:WD40 repeat protein/serine/threonine protein kinase